MPLKIVKSSAAYKTTQEFLGRYERFLMPSTLLGGTIIDAVQFRTFSIETTFIISGVYAVLCGLAMIVMVTPMRDHGRLMKYAHLAAPYVQQFTIGALLSTALLFYWFSGSLGASWPLLLLVALLMVSNEVFRGYFLLPTVQVGVYAFASLSLFATFFAYWLNSLSPWVFVLGGLASVLYVVGFLVLFVRIGRLEYYRRTMWFIVTGVFAIMNIAYFLNLIPPIPLSLREAGMYYSVARSNGDYVLVGEDESILESLIPGQTMHISQGDRLYAYSTIFAPADLSATIIHTWEYKDETEGWTEIAELPFVVTGGRDEGFRGYSYLTNTREGTWRVTVKTARGQVLGRIPFRVEYNEGE
ncbi:MAG: hypothetical protein UY72_C0004G0013 [Candidatus Uhrbacteria bacterium GW2011_GWD2_52_7]|uniref:DUF2914 domain-containing protein n=1 Tax=Candidatus Uhrbacteria bacterium GW2011_GWD2_52_7 TaxID=1618989 RepID=A0A0G2AE56_9BACT|nr:MAG: hypothetical protein UY72_C0004G0013 [Candidatus Uhrbacteria bacterium GW2011_GWD2_52_7]